MWAVPVLYADRRHYDPKRGGEFFQYLQFRLALQGEDPQVSSGEQPFVEVKDVSGFFEQVGHNTDYIIHPEEIMADNFALALSGEAAATKNIPEALLRVLHETVKEAK